MQLEVIGIQIGREALAVSPQFSRTQVHGENPVSLTGTEQRLALEVEDVTIPRIDQTFAVRPHPVYRHDVAQILNRPCRQQTVPVQTPRARPVGGIQQ